MLNEINVNISVSLIFCNTMETLTYSHICRWHYSLLCRPIDILDDMFHLLKQHKQRKNATWFTYKELMLLYKVRVWFDCSVVKKGIDFHYLDVHTPYCLCNIYFYAHYMSYNIIETMTDTFQGAQKGPLLTYHGTIVKRAVKGASVCAMPSYKFVCNNWAEVKKK